jgi:hypothetical protein
MSGLNQEMFVTNSLPKIKTVIGPFFYIVWKNFIVSHQAYFKFHVRDADSKEHLQSNHFPNFHFQLLTR